jgi:glycosyltransferase involved in cell wall biosynthesis
MYPVSDYIYFGIHVKEQIDSLKNVKGISADVHFINGREKKTNYFKSIAQIRNKIKNEKYDLIHVHYGLSALFLLFLDPKIPVVITLHSGELFRKKGLINHLMQKAITLAAIKKATKVIVLNDSMVDLLSIHKEKLIKLPCGTDLKVFDNKSVQTNGKKIRIGFPGNKGRKEKNYPLFANILGLLNKSHAIEVIEFHNLTRAEVVANLSKIDLLLMTSTVEGSPQIIKEAMACNKPIVSTSVGDVKDLLADVKNAYVIDSFNPDRFVEPVCEILDLHPAERFSNGREKLIRMKLDSVQVSERLYDIYDTVL